MRRALGLAGLAALALALTPAAPGGAVGDYAATASADGVRVGMAVRRFLVVEQFVDAGLPSAQAHVDSLGNSRSWAAYPFPGDVVISAPGTVAGFGPPGLPALPPYPLHAAATYPTQRSAAAGGAGFALEARAGERSAKALARAGHAAEDVRVGVTRSDASAGRTAEGVAEAVAESTVEGFSAGDVLRIGRVRSRAAAGAQPGGAVSREAETTVAEVTVAGQAVAIGPAGLTTPGGAVPLPDAAPAREALTDAGVSVRYLAPVETETGVVAAGVEVNVHREIAGVGEAVVSYVLGRASAFADAAPDSPAGPGPELPVTGPGTGAPAGDQGGGESAGGEAPVPAGAPGDGETGVTTPSVGTPAVRRAAGTVPRRPPTAVPAAPPQTPAVPPPPPAAQPAPLPSDPAETALVPGVPAGAVVPGPNFSEFLPVLAAGGAAVAAAVVAAGRLLRRTSWTS